MDDILQEFQGKNNLNLTFEQEQLLSGEDPSWSEEPSCEKPADADLTAKVFGDEVLTMDEIRRILEDDEREMEMTAEDEDGVTNYELFAMIEVEDEGAFLVFAAIDDEAQSMEILFTKCIENPDKTVSLEVLDPDDDPETFEQLQEIFEEMMGDPED